MMAGRSVVRADATAAVPSSQWRPSRLLDAEYPDELSRGLRNLRLGLPQDSPTKMTEGAIRSPSCNQTELCHEAPFGLCRGS